MNEQAYKAWDDMNDEVRERFKHQYKAHWQNILDHDPVTFYDALADAHMYPDVFEAWDRVDDIRPYIQPIVDAKIEEQVKFEVDQAMDEWTREEMKAWIGGKLVVEEDKPRLFANGYIKELL